MNKLGGPSFQGKNIGIDSRQASKTDFQKDPDDKNALTSPQNKTSAKKNITWTKVDTKDNRWAEFKVDTQETRKTREDENIYEYAGKLADVTVRLEKEYKINKINSKIDNAIAVALTNDPFRKNLENPEGPNFVKNLETTQQVLAHANPNSFDKVQYLSRNVSLIEDALENLSTTLDKARSDSDLSKISEIENKISTLRAMVKKNISTDFGEATTLSHVLGLGKPAEDFANDPESYNRISDFNRLLEVSMAPSERAEYVAKHTAQLGILLSNPKDNPVKFAVGTLIQQNTFFAFSDKQTAALKNTSRLSTMWEKENFDPKKIASFAKLVGLLDEDMRKLFIGLNAASIQEAVSSNNQALKNAIAPLAPQKKI